MYRAFKLAEIDWGSTFKKSGEDQNRTQENLVQKCFQAFIEKGEINGTLLKDEWFPEVKADVFISHSHADKESALRLAGWLQDNFGLMSFIDSCVWGHSDVLLRELDDAHCFQADSRTYNYNKRNGTTSHVHMMLATAISRMLDAAECVIFVSTPHSVSSSTNLDSKVSSPWIFYELAQMEVLRRRPPQRMVKIANDQRNFSVLAEAMKIQYTVNFDSLAGIDADVLNSWRSRFCSGTLPRPHALDILYGIVPNP